MSKKIGLLTTLALAGAFTLAVNDNAHAQSRDIAMNTMETKAENNKVIGLDKPVVRETTEDDVPSTIAVRQNIIVLTVVGGTHFKYKGEVRKELMSAEEYATKLAEMFADPKFVKDVDPVNIMVLWEETGDKHSTFAMVEVAGRTFKSGNDASFHPYFQLGAKGGALINDIAVYYHERLKAQGLVLASNDAPALQGTNAVATTYENN